MLNLVCMGFSMIDQSLVDHVESYIIDGRDLPVNVTENILDAYIKLIEQNAELHKELAKFKAQSFNFNNGVQCSNIPNDLAM